MKRVLRWTDGAPPTQAHYERRIEEIERNAHDPMTREHTISRFKAAWEKWHRENGGTYANQRRERDE